MDGLPDEQLRVRGSSETIARLEEFHAANGVTFSGILEAWGRVIASMVDTHGWNVDAWPDDAGPSAVTRLVQLGRSVDDERKAALLLDAGVAPTPTS